MGVRNSFRVPKFPAWQIAAPKKAGPGAVVPRRPDARGYQICFENVCDPDLLRLVRTFCLRCFWHTKFRRFFPAYLRCFFFVPRTGDFFGMMEIDKIRNASSAAVSPVSLVRAVSPLSDIIIDLENMCFIEVKRYISDRLLYCGVFG